MLTFMEQIGFQLQALNISYKILYIARGVKNKCCSGESLDVASKYKISSFAFIHLKDSTTRIWLTVKFCILPLINPFSSLGPLSWQLSCHLFLPSFILFYFFSWSPTIARPLTHLCYWTIFGCFIHLFHIVAFSSLTITIVLQQYLCLC